MARSLLEQWLDGRPEEIKKLARRYPPGTRFVLPDGEWWLLSYHESDEKHGPFLGLVRTPPGEDYEKALAEDRVYVCADHFIETARYGS